MGTPTVTEEEAGKGQESGGDRREKRTEEARGKTVGQGSVPTVHEAPSVVQGPGAALLNKVLALKVITLGLGDTNGLVRQTVRQKDTVEKAKQGSMVGRAV